MPSIFALAAVESGGTVSWTDFQSVITAVSEQFSVTTAVGVLAAVVGASVGLAFMWWGLRKGLGALMSAFQKGKVKV